ncbi:autotransporter outer membrane beta-barrel domain-containing protein [Leminorella grimontii]|uniref:autotransporter outer membrane beta-barrel domain-containing protein n=1 Tax=Leminorella grimontii TaxID=82981 RepID=UPI00321FB359
MILTPGMAFASCVGLNTASVVCTGSDPAYPATVSSYGSGQTTAQLTDWAMNGGALVLSSLEGGTVTANGVTITNGTSSYNGMISMLSSTGAGDVSINVSNSNLTAETTTQGVVAEIRGTGTGNASVTLTDTDITLNSGAAGGGVNILAYNGGNASITINSGKITTNPNNSNAVSLISDAAGDINAQILGGQLQTFGTGANGIAARYQTASTTGVTTINNHANIATAGAKANGMRITNVGKVDITNYGDIATAGDAALGIYVLGENAGDVIVENRGRIQTAGASSSAIVAQGIGQVKVDNYAELTTAGDSAFGISAYSADGPVFINNAGTITSGGAMGHLISGSTVSGTVNIVNTANLRANGVSGRGISGESSGVGNVFITNQGSITNEGFNSGIVGISRGGGNITIENHGAIGVNGYDPVSDDGAIAIATLVRAGGTGSIFITNDAALTSTGSQNASGIRARNLGAGNVAVNNAGAITTTGSQSHAIYTVGNVGQVDITNSGVLSTSGLAAGGIQAETAGGNVSIDHSGSIDTLSELAIMVNNSAAGTLNLKNSGRITGGIQAVNTSTDFDNIGEWNLRNVADTTGDGTRDTLAVAVNDFGVSGGNAITNSGTMTLLGDGGLATTLNNSGEYRTGYAANSMAIGGAAQAQLLGVQTFSNSGAINMGNGAVGDVLVISGGQTPGASGNGVFVANGGQITVDTVLNDGGANSASDMLVVDGTRLGSAATGIKVNNLGGQGLQTVDDGIEIVRVLDASQSAADVFKLSNRVVAGAYEYDLYQGGVGENADNGNWYLRSQLAPRAETGSYVANMAAASKMFNLRLEDREGRAENSSMWLRQQGDRTTFRDGSGQVKTSTNTYVIQGGGEVAHMQFGADDRLGLGLMLGYGQSSSKSVNGHSDYSSKGKVDGYSGGVYATWYQDAKTLDGLYVDSWVQYSLLDASVNGEQLASESYDMKGFSASVEGGYRMPVYQGENSRVYVTPQAQVIWNGVKADDHREANGTKVTSDGDNNVQTRLGVKLSRDGVSNMDKGSDKLFTVYTEANWLHNTERAGATLDGVTTRQAGSTNVGELKLGMEGQLSQHANVWTNVAQQLGDDGYSDTALTVGFKYKF